MKQDNCKKSLTALAVAGTLAVLAASQAQADTTTATIMGQAEDGSSISSGLVVELTPYYSKSDKKTYPYTSIRTETGIVANDWSVMNSQKSWPQGGRSGWWGTFNYSLGHLTNAGYGLQTYTADDEEVKSGKKQVGDFKKSGTNRYAYDTTKQYNYTMAWGVATNASSSFATAWGETTAATGMYSTAFGYWTEARGTHSLAAGNKSKATGNYAFAFGNEVTASKKWAVAFGNKTVASNDASTAFGSDTTASGFASLAFGAYSTASGYSSIAGGYEATASGDDAVAISKYATASGADTVAIGTNTEATQSGALALGRKAKAKGYTATAVGNESVAAGYGSTALGGGNVDLRAMYGMSLGYKSSVLSESAVAIGAYSVADRKSFAEEYSEGTQPYGYSSKISSDDTVWKSTASAVSVGGVNGGTTVTRQITGIAAGTELTDAVNVAQLKAVYSDLNDRIGEAAEGASDTHVAAGEYTADADGKVTLKLVDKDGSELENQAVTITDVAKASDLAKVDAKVGDLAYSKVEGTVIADNDSVTDAIGKLNNRASEALTEAAKHTTASGGSNIEVTATETDGQKNYEVSLKKDISVDSVTAGDADGGNSFAASSDGAFANYGDTNVAIDAAGGFSAGKGSTYVQADGKTAELGTETSGIAASDGKIEIAGGSTTVTVTDSGADFGGAKATGIAAAELSAASTDAVNGSQLYATNQKVDENSSNIEKLYRKTGDLSKKLNRTGANAAALAALHPLDFDENHKVSASVGFGQYHGSSALAVGVFVRPTENLMFNLGGSFASDDKMFNAGMSYRFGDNGAKPVATNAQMADRVNSLTAENRDLSAQLKASNTKLESVAAENAGLRAEIEAIKAKLGMK